MQIPVRVTGDGSKFWCPLCAATKGSADGLEAHIRLAHNAKRPIEVVARDEYVSTRTAYLSDEQHAEFVAGVTAHMREGHGDPVAPDSDGGEP